MNPFVIAFRRIIYSIPLKRLLVGLAVFSVLLASFSSALELPSSGFTPFDYDIQEAGYEDSYVHYINGSQTIGSTSTKITLNSKYDLVCIRRNDSSCQFSLDNSKFYNVAAQSLTCWNGEGSFYLKNCSNWNAFYFEVGEGGLDYENYTSLQCQIEYNLIPISSVDQNYCTTNNLCPTYDCPTNPIGTGSLSNLYINNILHVGAPNIIMNIPEEIDWDYAYTLGGNTMNIDIVGYNQDYEKIEDWIYTNNYKPSSDDFTNIFTNFSNFGGLLIATLFVILVFYFVKKMFK